MHHALTRLETYRAIRLPASIFKIQMDIRDQLAG